MPENDPTTVLASKLKKILFGWPISGMGGTIHVNLIYRDARRDQQALGFLQSLHKSEIIRFKSHELGQLPQELITADGCLKLENAERAYACPVAFIEAPSLSTRSQVIEGLSDIVSIAKVLTEAANKVACPDDLTQQGR